MAVPEGVGDRTLSLRNSRLVALAARINRWLVANKRLIDALTWICMAVTWADTARFIDLPTIVKVPFWAGVVAGVLRWTVWQTFVRRWLMARIAEKEKAPAADETPSAD